MSVRIQKIESLKENIRLKSIFQHKVLRSCEFIYIYMCVCVCVCVCVYSYILYKCIY